MDTVTNAAAPDRRGRAPGRKPARAPGRLALASVVLAVCVLAAACGSGTTAAGPSGTPPPSAAVLHVLVTNDDGVGAPGIDAAVQALRALPHTQVTVVAPLTNQSGTGGRTTTGTLTVSGARTASGYPAKAVHGYPADTIVWAITDHGVARRPDLVVSGINFGQNIGPLADLSGTVGAARKAVSLGIPALAVSQGIDDGVSADFAQGAHQLVAWVQAHRAALLAKASTSPTSPVPAAVSGNLNVPTCTNGNVRGPVDVPAATSLAGIDIGTVNCSSTATDPADDAQGFVDGFAVVAPLTAGT